MKFKTSPLRYPGSKARVLKKIVPYLVEARKYCNEFREPFVGGGSVFINSGDWDVKWANDTDPGVAAFFKIVRDEPDSLIQLILGTTPTIPVWEEIKYSHPETDLDHAFRFFFLNRTNYSGIIGANPIGGYQQLSQYPINCRWNPKSLIRRIKAMSNSLQGSMITNDDFFFVVNRPSMGRAFLFLDPPYYEKGNQLYDYGMCPADHERLRDLLSTTEHLFLLTYDDCDPIWKLYGKVPGLYFSKRQWKYTTATVSANKRKMGNELFISNFRVAHVPMYPTDEFDTISHAF